MKEQISALIDGETDDLERERTLRAVHTDPELLGTWERYHLARTALRRELDIVVSPGLVDRVRDRLRDEHPDAAARRLLSPRALRYSAGLAIAASVAAVAILNLTPVIKPAGPATARSAPAARSLAAETRPVAPELQRALNPYLVRHAEFSSASSVNSMSAYARVVGRDGAPAESNGAE